MIMLGSLLQPMLSVYKVANRGLGIVRYHFGETKLAIEKTASWFTRLFAFRLALAALALWVLFHGSGTEGHMLAAAAVGVPGGGGGFSKQLAAYLGRDQGPEFFTSVSPTLAAPTTINISKNLSLNRPLKTITLRVAFRDVIGVADMTAAAAESPMTILNRVIIQGTFKGSALTPISAQGSTLFARTRCFGLRGSSCYINGVRQADLNVPFAQTLANFGVQGSYDIEIFYVIPVGPVIANSRRANEIVPYYWQPQDWADSLQIRLEMGDSTAFGTNAGGTTHTFTAFGAATGTPIVEIFTNYVILGTVRPGNLFRTACLIFNESQITSGVTAVAANVRLMPLQKQKTTNVLVKTGVNLTTVTSGVQVFASLSDVMLDKTVIMVDNKQIRNNQSNKASKESIGYNFSTILPGGYQLWSFIDSQTPKTAFRADDPNVVGAGSAFELDTDVTSAGANQVVNVVQEMIFADRDDPSWMGTR